MEVLHTEKKGNTMNTLEGFHIYNKTKTDNQINDKGTVKQNNIFDKIIQRNSGRGHPTQQPPVHSTDLIQL